MKELLERISHGYIPDEYLKRLAATLARIYNKADNSQREEYARLAHEDMKVLSARIYDALEKGILPPLLIQMSPTLSVRAWSLHLLIMLMPENICLFLQQDLSIR